MMDLSGVSESTSGDLKTVVGIPPRNFRNHDDIMRADCSHRLNNFLRCMIQHNRADISQLDLFSETTKLTKVVLCLFQIVDCYGKFKYIIFVMLLDKHYV